MKHALVVDDSAVIRKIAKRMLASLNFSVQEAENGAAALNYCRQTMPDVILLDWNMPVMDGMEFFEQLQTMPRRGRAKVVFCTTENEKSKILRVIEAGADEYIMKPFDEHILRLKLQQIGLISAESE
ncbi:MAG: response regulator [Hyphomicrobiales bacterium]|nr:response regulator [Hyphomicrobiales bacterium]